MGLLLLLTLYWIYKYGFNVFNPLNNDLKVLNKYLPSLDNDPEENYHALDQYFRSNRLYPALKTVWSRFSTDMENTSMDMEIEEYFNTIHLIQIPANRKKAETKAAMIMTLGFLAGFVRLMTSLRVMDFSADQSTVIITLITDMVIITVIAMILSILYQSIDKHLYQTAVNETYMLQTNLKRKISVQKEAVHFGKVAVSIDTLAQNLGSYASKSLEEQHSALERMVEMFLERLNGTMHGQFLSFAQTMEELSVAQIRSKQQVDGLIQELIKGTSHQKEINQTTQTIIASIAAHDQQVTEGSKDLAVNLHHLKQMTESLNEVLAFNQEALNSVKTEKESIKSEYNKYFESINSQIQRYQKDAGIELEKVLVRFTEVSAKSFDRLEGSVVKSMDIWSGANKTLLTNMESQTMSLVGVSSDIAQRLNELSLRLETTMKDFTDALHNGTTHTLSDFDNGLGEITERLSKTVTDIRDSIDDLPMVIEDLKKNLSSK